MLEEIAGNPLELVSRLHLAMVLLWVAKVLHRRYSVIWVVLSFYSFSLINLFLGGGPFICCLQKALGNDWFGSSSLLLLAQGFFDG